MPYVVDAAVQAMAATKHLILCAAQEAGDLLRLSRQADHLDPARAPEVHVLARKEQDPIDALARLADALHAPKVAAPDYRREAARSGAGR